MEEEILTSAPVETEENNDELQAEVIEKAEEPEKTNMDPIQSQEENAYGEILAEMNGKLDHLTQLFTQKIQHTAHEEIIVDQMHAELQRYKEDMYSQLVRPILLDIIEIRDSILRMNNCYLQKPKEEQNISLKVFSDYAYDIQDILEKNNISIYKGEEGEAFNPVKQRAIKKVKTPIEKLHGKIAESLSYGYDYLGKTISPEKVTVYVYEEPVETEGENE